MPTGVKVYKMVDFIRKNESGELSKDRIREIIGEIGSTSTKYPNHNILIDNRETTISYHVSMSDILKSAIELSVFKKTLTNKIANIIPKDENRRTISEKMEAAVQIKGIKYKCFTDFETAIEWLSNIEYE